MKDYYGYDIKTYIIEVEINGEKRYVHSKRVAVHFKDMARKFSHKKSAKRFYCGSEFSDMNCKFEVIEFDEEKDGE